MAYAGTPPKTAARGIREQSALTRMKPLFNYLESNYQSQVSPQNAAEIVHMSSSSFRRVFKQVTGQSFVEYLNQFRIAKAQELLSTTDMPITDIGLEVGFCDQSYFGMIFRRLTRTTPRHFRQQALEGNGARNASPLAHAVERKKRIAK
jgi:transcriptional regulator GlxA family with amidase domain